MPNFPPSYEGLLAGEPVTASFLGVLRDKNKNIILDSVFLRTRAQCSEAIMKSVEKGNGTINGGAFLDMSANKELQNLDLILWNIFEPVFLRHTIM